MEHTGAKAEAGIFGLLVAVEFFFFFFFLFDPVFLFNLTHFLF